MLLLLSEPDEQGSSVEGMLLLASVLLLGSLYSLVRFPLFDHGLWSLLGFGYWAIEEKAAGGFVGELGFADFKRDIEPSLGRIAQVKAD